MFTQAFTKILTQAFTKIRSSTAFLLLALFICTMVLPSIPWKLLVGCWSALMIYGGASGLMRGEITISSNGGSEKTFVGLAARLISAVTIGIGASALVISFWPELWSSVWLRLVAIGA